MDRIIKENKKTLWSGAYPCKKIFVYHIIPCNLLNEEFDNQINYCFDNDKEIFNIERKKYPGFYGCTYTIRRGITLENGGKTPWSIKIYSTE